MKKGIAVSGHLFVLSADQGGKWNEIRSEAICQGMSEHAAVYGKKERTFIKKLADDLDQEKDYATICEEAGNPKDTAMAYLENCDEDYLIKKAFKRSLLKKLLLLILVIIIVFIIYACYMLIEYNRLAETQQIITYEEIITVY